MTRNKKIEFLKDIKAGKIDIKELILENSLPLPSWYWIQFDTPEQLLADIKKEMGESCLLRWHEGKPYVINKNKVSKSFNWFNYE